MLFVSFTLPRDGCLVKSFHCWKAFPLHVLVLPKKPEAQYNAEEEDKETESGADPHAASYISKLIDCTRLLSDLPFVVIWTFGRRKHVRAQ